MPAQPELASRRGVVLYVAKFRLAPEAYSASYAIGPGKSGRSATLTAHLQLVSEIKTDWSSTSTKTLKLTVSSNVNLFIIIIFLMG
jgi:hypothetical protein